jgi:uncharacterized membrane protein
VPYAAVTVGSVLTIICLFALLFYVHKVARAIVADNIVAGVANDLRDNVHRMLPKAGGSNGDMPEDIPPIAGTVSLGRSGYIQVIDYDRLVSAACREGALLQVKVRAGHFVLKGGEHVVVHAARPLGDDAVEAIRDAFVVGEERSPAQDLEHGLRQLVEIALRALSPGINDPYTAIAVVDRLGAALEEIFQRSLLPSALHDKEGMVRVIAQRSDVQGLVDAAFDPIRQAGQDIPAVLIRMADVLGQLASVLRPGEAQDAVVQHLGKLTETAEAARLAPCDRRAILLRVERARIATSTRSKEANIHVL